MERIKRVLRQAAMLSCSMLLCIMLAKSLQAGFVENIEFDCDVLVDVFGEPKLGEPFEVEFRFTPQAEIKHERGVSDSAYMRVHQEGVSFVSGDTLWVGRLEQGQTYSMRATFVCNAEVRFRVRGIVQAMEVLGVVGLPGTTIRAFGGTSSRLLDFRVDPPPDGFSFESITLETTNSGELVVVPTPDSLRHVVDREEFHRRRRERLESQGSVYGLPRTRSSGDEKQKKTSRTNKVTLTLEKLVALDTISLYRNGFNLIKLGDQIQNLKILNDSSFRFDRSGGGAFRLDVLRPDTALEIQLGDSTYVLPVKFISTWNLSGRVTIVTYRPATYRKRSSSST